MSRMNLNETSNSKRLFAANTVDQTLKSPTLTADQRYDSEASLVSIGSTMSVMEQPHSLAVLGNITQVGTIIKFLTLLMAQSVDMEALESENHASHLCFFDSLGAIRQISSHESALIRMVTHLHGLSV